jgi:hypothetical protein
MGSRVKHLRGMAAGHVINRPFALQPIGGGFKGGEGLYVAIGRYDKGQGLAPVDFYQN